MRLFSKVREGTAFDVGSQNSKFHSAQPVVRQQLHSDTAEEQQIQLQAAKVAIEAAQILAQAERLKQAAAPDTAQLWTDGSLGEDEGLPPRKTRIYIPSSAAVRCHSSPSPSTANSTNGEQHVKKKRKGKAERNRLKREAALASSVT